MLRWEKMAWRSAFGGAMKAGLAAGAVAWYLDEKGLVRPWRRVRHAMFVPSVVGEPTKIMELFFRVKACPPPIGCAEWPAGRVLLEMALDMIPPSDETVLEIGAGVGVTALGLAKSSAAARALHIHTQPTAVVATDICEASLENLRTNAASNGITVRPVRSNHEQGYHDVVDGELPPATLTVGLWDAAGGQGAVQRLNLDLGIDARDLTHVLGADIMYHGFDNVAAAANEGLVSTLAALLKANPNIQITLLLVDRFSGGAVAAVSQVAGVNQMSHTLAPMVDPAITNFEQQCERHGLHHQSFFVPAAIRSRVRATQTWRQRCLWFFSGYWEGLIVYRITAGAG